MSIHLEKHHKFHLKSNRIFLISFICTFNLSCSDHQADFETLHFTTKHGIKTTLDTGIEMYRADNDTNLFYINFRYYKKNQNNLWQISSTPDGPWKTFPDQNMAPESLRLQKNKL